MGGHRFSALTTDDHRPVGPAPPDPGVRAGGFVPISQEVSVKRAEEVMEVPEAFDLVGTLPGAAELAGCDHKTVAHFVAERDRAGGVWRGSPGRAPGSTGSPDKVEELVDRSRGRIRDAGPRLRDRDP
jgi:hypothetical protein